MTNKNQMKMAVISGASLALKIKNEKSSASDSDILQEISYQMDEILEKIDKSL